MAAGVAAGTNYLEQDPELALLAGVQVGSVAAGMTFVGAWAERKRMTRIAWAAAGLASQLSADGGRAPRRPPNPLKPGYSSGVLAGGR